jgi:hypothetical protein
MMRQQPLSYTALIITTVLLTGGANVSAFVPANYRNPSFGPTKVVNVNVFPGDQFAFALHKQPHRNGNAPRSSSSSERQSSSGTSSTSTSLQMVAPTGAALAAITGAMTGGLFAGGLHAMSGTFNDYL